MFGMDHLKIRKARRRAGLTQEELGASLGVNRFTIIRWEGGVNAPSPRHWPALRELGVPVSALERMADGVSS